MALSLGLGVGFYKLGGSSPLAAPGVGEVEPQALELWLKNAAKGGTFFGSHIVQWYDFSGYDRHAKWPGWGGSSNDVDMNPTTGAIPLLRSAPHYFEFQGSNSTITLDDQLTLFVVAEFDIPSTANNMYMLSNGNTDGAGESNIRIFDSSVSTVGQYAMIRDNAGQRFITESESGGEDTNTLKDGVKSIISIQREGNDIGDKVVFKVNGVNIPDDSTGGTYGAANDNGTLTLTNFGLNNTTQQGPHGNFFEVVLYSTFLDGDNYTNVYNDIATRCDLPNI
jgi:hypothetical protein